MNLEDALKLFAQAVTTRAPFDAGWIKGFPTMSDTEFLAYCVKLEQGALVFANEAASDAFYHATLRAAQTANENWAHALTPEMQQAAALLNDEMLKHHFTIQDPLLADLNIFDRYIREHAPTQGGRWFPETFSTRDSDFLGCNLGRRNDGTFVFKNGAAQDALLAALDKGVRDDIAYRVNGVSIPAKDAFARLKDSVPQIALMNEAEKLSCHTPAQAGLIAK